MEINLKSKRTTLKTAKKYCPEDITVDVALQDKTVTPIATAQTVKADDGYAGLGTVEVTAAARTAIKAIDLSYGEQSVTYSSSEGIGLTGAGKVTYADDTVDDITKDLEIPIIAGDGLIMDAVTDNTKAQFKLDPEHSVYMAAKPTAENAIPVYAKSSKSWISIVATPSATASSVVSRDANGRFQAGAPENDGDVVIKSTLDAAIAEVSKQVGPTGPTGPTGPASNAGEAVTIEGTAEATNGNLTETQMIKLQANENNYIMFNHKKYSLEGKGHQEGYLTYTYAGYENSLHNLESITITINTRAWVLNTTDVLDRDEITELVTPLIPTIPAAPTWQTTAPTIDADKKKVQFTKVIISTTDETSFPGMNGKYVIVPGFTNDGFHYGTIVCSQADPAYEFPFIGSITSEMASGTIVKPSVAPTYISVVDPAVTFTYEYLW